MYKWAEMLPSCKLLGWPQLSTAAEFFCFFLLVYGNLLPLRPIVALFFFLTPDLCYNSKHCV